MSCLLAMPADAQHVHIPPYNRIQSTATAGHLQMQTTRHGQTNNKTSCTYVTARLTSNCWEHIWANFCDSLHNVCQHVDGAAAAAAAAVAASCTVAFSTAATDSKLSSDATGAANGTTAGAGAHSSMLLLSRLPWAIALAVCRPVCTSG
jgi:hypothetical protein